MQITLQKLMALPVIKMEETLVRLLMSVLNKYKFLLLNNILQENTVIRRKLPLFLSHSLFFPLFLFFPMYGLVAPDLVTEKFQRYNFRKRKGPSEYQKADFLQLFYLLF